MAWEQDTAHPKFLSDLVESAWGIIANVNGMPDRTNQSPEWHAATRDWKDRYHAWLKTQYPAAPESQA